MNEDEKLSVLKTFNKQQLILYSELWKRTFGKMAKEYVDFIQSVIDAVDIDEAHMIAQFELEKVKAKARGVGLYG